MESISCHPYDSNRKVAIFTKSCFCTTDIIKFLWNFCRYHHSFYTAWQVIGICGTATFLFYLSDSMYFALHGTCHSYKKGLCSSLQGMAVDSQHKPYLFWGVTNLLRLPLVFTSIQTPSVVYCSTSP